jgi:hypothetical protein
MYAYGVAQPGHSKARRVESRSSVVSIVGHFSAAHAETYRTCVCDESVVEEIGRFATASLPRKLQLVQMKPRRPGDAARHIRQLRAAVDWPDDIDSDPE